MLRIPVAEPVERVIELRFGPPIIGLTGPAGSGKDLVAALLSMVGFEHVSFGHELRVEIERSIDCGTVPLDCDMPRFIQLDWLGTTQRGLWQKPTAPHTRRLLQWWGTEFRRTQNPDYWVDRMAASMRPGIRYVLSDLRFENEQRMIRQRGGQVWRVDRSVAPSNGMPGHSSESFEGIFPDRILPNHLGLKELAAETKRYLAIRTIQ